ncbi:MAG: 50S ribosomal protein L25/general stress protein Ctc [Halofilum sp. (in: g-proteobacteria)]
MSSDSDFTLEAQTRQNVGKGASRRLRREKKVPAVVYGGKDDARSLTLSHDEVYRKLQSEAFFSHILTLNVDGKNKQRAILRDLQRHPFKPLITHMDFLRVVEDQEINVRVPLHFTGEEECVGVRMHGGEVSHLESEVEVTCLPKHLPEYIEIDMTELDVGATVHLSDLKLPEGVTIVALTHGEDYDAAVASIHMPRVAAEEEAEEAEEAATEGEEAEAEGEEGAEGEGGEEASADSEEKEE